MGTHGAVGAKARAVTAGNRANKSTDASPGGSRFLNLSNWPVSRRLFAVIVLALVMGLVFGGLRIASAESSASQFGRVSQLATLGQRLTVLIQDLQDERDQTLTYLASSQAEPLAPYYARTDSAVVAVQGATAGIGSGFPVNIQNGVATVNADITGPRLKNLHNTLSPQAPQDELAVIANYGAVISDMINLADQTAQGVSDASLTSDVRAFNALALAKEQLSQQRALLNYSFSNPGDVTPACERVCRPEHGTGAADRFSGGVQQRVCVPAGRHAGRAGIPRQQPSAPARPPRAWRRRRTSRPTSSPTKARSPANPEARWA